MSAKCTTCTVYTCTVLLKTGASNQIAVFVIYDVYFHFCQKKGSNEICSIIIGLSFLKKRIVYIHCVTHRLRNKADQQKSLYIIYAMPALILIHRHLYTITFTGPFVCTQNEDGDISVK